MENIFLKHPEDVGFTYFQHMRWALTRATQFFLCGLACVIHSVFPFVFVTTASEYIKDLHEKFEGQYK